VIALINSAYAINIRDSADESDLFNDDSQEAETLKSIKEAEALHGKALPASIADENLKEILVQKSKVEFGNDDEFIKLSKGTTVDKTLLQTDSQLNFEREARPIGELMAQIGGVNGVMSELGGSDDSNDVDETLQSIQSAELAQKSKLGQVVASTKAMVDTHN
jgi:hypothetical protein